MVAEFEGRMSAEVRRQEKLDKMKKNISVIRRVCGQTLGLGLVDRYRTVVIISLQ